MSNLYEKVTHGDRRTIVRKYKKGAKLAGSHSSIITLKANVALKVTQEFRVMVTPSNEPHGEWFDVTVHLGDMVETSEPVTVEDEKQAPLPRAESLPKPTWFERIFGVFYK